MASVAALAGNIGAAVATWSLLSAVLLNPLSVFGADPDVLDRSVTVAGTPATIIGTLPRGFRGLRLSEAPDLYLPLHVAGDIDFPRFNASDPLGAPGMTWIRVVGCLHLELGGFCRGDG